MYMIEAMPVPKSMNSAEDSSSVKNCQQEMHNVPMAMQSQAISRMRSMIVLVDWKSTFDVENLIPGKVLIGFEVCTVDNLIFRGDLYKLIAAELFSALVPDEVLRIQRFAFFIYDHHIFARFHFFIAFVTDSVIS